MHLRRSRPTSHVRERSATSVRCPSTCRVVSRCWSRRCPCCQGQLHKIGEAVSEVLDVIPAMLQVLRTVRPKYACRSCTDGVVQAKVLPRLIESGMA
ncbi:IS66 family transposase zinc-finger binding domain-containing protein [Bradyrhizobium sp. UFLA01-814]